MNPRLEANGNRIIELCKAFGVMKLEAFGIANTPEFDPSQDDFEFIAEFSEDGRYVPSVHEPLLGRPVVLVDETRLKSGFAESIAPTREGLFTSSNRMVAA
jgi:hypothetical protein